MKESLTYQAILQEGEAIGEAKGKAEGAVAEAKRMLMMMGLEQFGPPDRRSEAALASINELPRLEKLGVRLLSAKSWEELLKPRRRNGRRPQTS